MNRLEPVISSLGATDRRDAWWLYPLAVAIGFSVLGTYAFVAAALNGHYAYGGLLSPFYSPLVQLSWWPSWLSPAFLILGFPLGFRATCYYYRKAYYRSFFFHPPACAVGEGRTSGYSGERAFPWVAQNLHRFFMYAAVVFIFILAYDVILAMRIPYAADGSFIVNPYVVTPAKHKWGMSVGTLVLAVNVWFLAAYTFGCHSLRHLVGGKHDCFSCHTAGGPEEPASFKAWKGVSWLNARHEKFAWISFFTVCFADLYIRLCSMGVWNDYLFFALNF